MLPEQEARLIKDYMAGQVPRQGQKKRRGCLGSLFRLVLVGIFGLAFLYGVVAITNPWSFHIGGRWTPFMTWHGYGDLVTKGGMHYPLYITFYPSSHFSQLHLQGLRPTGGLQGSGWLCTSPGVTQRLDLSGTIYGGWRSTAGSLMSVRIFESNRARDRLLGTTWHRGYFDVLGHWNGPELLMSDHGEWSSTFRSGLRIEQASVTLSWGTYSDFKDLCAKRRRLSAGR